MREHTLKKSYEFRGKGLHTGAFANMTISPAPDGYGIRFRRTDLGKDNEIRALACNVCDAAFNTSLEENGAKVMLVEHVLSALSGLGVDNALIAVDNLEIPVLDGSARPFVEAIASDGLQEQQKERRFVRIDKSFTYRDDRTDAWISLEPCESFEASLTIDFNSQVVGVQTCDIDSSTDYASQIAPCRTFCFFSQLEQLAAAGQRVARLFNAGGIKVRRGYLNNVDLHFRNECARHKMLDLIGDFSLLGAPLKARVTAYKTGHRVNTAAANILLKQLSQDTI